MTLKRRGFLIAAAMLAIGSGISPSFAVAQDTSAASNDPKVVVQNFYDALQETMKQGEQLGFEGRYKKLEPVIRETFDVPVMLKIAVGGQWPKFTPDEKKELLEAFNRYLITNYAARFKADKGLKLTVGEVKQPTGSSDPRLLVETTLVRSNGDTVSLNYLFRPSDAKEWKIIDVYYSGAISEMARMRSDFSATVTDGGANGLVAALEKKIEDIKREPAQ